LFNGLMAKRKANPNAKVNAAAALVAAAQGNPTLELLNYSGPKCCTTSVTFAQLRQLLLISKKKRSKLPTSAFLTTSETLTKKSFADNTTQPFW